MWAFYVCCAIGVIVFGAMIIAMVEFRKSKGAVPAKWSHNTKVEMVWTVRAHPDPRRARRAGDQRDDQHGAYRRFADDGEGHAAISGSGATNTSTGATSPTTSISFPSSTATATARAS